MNDQQTGSQKDTIFIVDDTPANLRLLSQLLTEHGYKVRAVTSGAQALESARTNPPDLILLDIVMPKMDGYEVCKRLKANAQTRDIPIIFISALSGTADKINAFTVGGVDYVTKPFRWQEVLARVETHLALRKLQKSLEEKNIQLEQKVIAHKQAEERVRQSQKTLETILDSMPFGVIIVSKDKKIRRVNNAALALMGYESAEQIIGKACHEAFGSSTSSMCAMLDEGQVVDRSERILVAQDGRHIPILKSIVPVTLDGERALIEAFVDITERKRAEDELMRYREQLEELVEERTRELEGAQAELVRKERLSVMGQLTAAVAHDLRNPLGAIRTSVFTIDMAIKRDQMDRVGRALQRIERNVMRCNDIIGELLDYTRDRALQLEPTHIDTWLGAVLDEQTFPKGIVCVRELTCGAQVPIDAEQLRRVVVNTVENGIHALQDAESRGNQLTVSTHAITDQAGSRLEIRISDTGCGIPADVLPRVFEPLFSTKSFGVGLGLSIIKNIMEKHGGGVEIQSEIGQGTRVTLWLPGTFD